MRNVDGDQVLTLPSPPLLSNPETCELPHPLESVPWKVLRLNSTGLGGLRHGLDTVFLKINEAR